MKHLFSSIALCSVLLACSAQASGSEPNKEWIDEAEKGNAYTQFDLGVWYESHYEYSEAAKWFRKAAEQRNAAAQSRLGELYENGQGVSRDYGEAMKWYWAAADQGSIFAQERLGILYENGQGVPKDCVQAYMWLQIAARQHDLVAARQREALEKTLLPHQVAEGQRLAHEWVQQHPEPKVDY